MSIRRMSQFAVEKGSGKGGRLGNFSFCGDTSVPTPAFFLHTTGGLVPHITPEVLNYVFPPGEERPPLQISLDSTLTFSQSIVDFEKGVAKFVGLPDSPVFLTVHNPLQQLRSGYNHAKGVSLWGRNGRKSLDLSEYSKLVKGYKPTFFQGLSDYDVTSESGGKRLKKSTGHTLEYFEKLLSSSDSQNNSGLFATIESSWFLANEDEATKTVKTMLEHLDQIQGFVISGFGIPLVQKDKKACPEKDKTALPIESVDYSLLDKIVSLLPPNRPRYIPGPFSPSQMLELISRGIDLFDTSFISRLADDGHVLLVKENHDFVNESLPTKNDENSSLPEEDESTSLFLKDKKYFSDFSPISKACSCYTCRKHTKSYIHHLYTTDELLGPVLVMIHNLTSINQLFTMTRRSLKIGTEAL